VISAPTKFLYSPSTLPLIAFCRPPVRDGTIPGESRGVLGSCAGQPGDFGNL